MKNKKGSHVGMILSFVIFITFVVFMFSILGPQTQTTEEREPVLNYLERELIKELSENLTLIRVLPDSTDSCLKLYLDDFDLRGLNAVVKNSNNIIVGSEISSNKKDLMFQPNNGENVFDVFVSEKLVNPQETPLSGCTSLGNSEIGFVRPNKYVFNGSLIDLEKRYNRQYIVLKKDLNFPESMEFSFTLTDKDKNIIIETESTEIATDVYSREIPIQYFNKEAELNSGFINLKIW